MNKKSFVTIVKSDVEVLKGLIEQAEKNEEIDLTMLNAISSRAELIGQTCTNMVFSLTAED